MAHLTYHPSIMTGWYSAKSFTHEDTDGTFSWIDQSGFENTLSLGSTAGTVLVQPYEHNGRTIFAPWFDGSSYCTSATTLNTWLAASDGHVFVAVATDPDSNMRHILSVTPTATRFGIAVGLATSGANTVYRSNYYCQGTTHTLDLPAGSVSPTTTVNGEVCVYSWSHTSSVFGWGGDFGFETSVAAVAQTLTGNIRLGASGDASGSFFQGAILEIIAFEERLTEANHLKVASYLCEEWGGRYAPHQASSLSGWRGDALEQQRENMSRKLFYFRKPVPLYEVSGTLELLAPDFGSDFYMSHADQPEADGKGWGDGADWTKRDLRALGFSMDMEKFSVALSAEDRRFSNVTFWESWTGQGVTDGTLNGVARLCAGNGAGTIVALKTWWSFIADADLQRITTVEPNKPAVNENGLLMMGQGTNVLTRSSFINGTTGLTLTGSGGGGRLIAAATTFPLLFEVSNVVTTSQVLEFSFVPGTAADLHAAWAATAALGANAEITVVIWHQAPLTNGKYLKWTLTRSSDGWYWNEGTSAFQAGVVWNETSSGSVSSPLWNKYVSSVIPLGAASSTVTLRVGWPSADLTDTQYARVGHVQIPASDPICVTTTAAVTGSADLPKVGRYSQGDNPIIPPDKGTFAIRFKPTLASTEYATDWEVWAQTALAAGSVDTGLALRFESSNSTMVAKYSQAGVHVEASAPVSWAADEEVDVVVRWTSSAGELGLTARTVSVFVNGVKGTDVARAADWSPEDLSFTYGSSSYPVYIIAAQGWREPLSDSEIAGWEA